jgi:hypothetical protein
MEGLMPSTTKKRKPEASTKKWRMWQFALAVVKGKKGSIVERTLTPIGRFVVTKLGVVGTTGLCPVLVGLTVDGEEQLGARSRACCRSSHAR